MLCGLSLRRLIAQVFPRLAEVGEQKVIDGRQEPAAILVARYQDPEGLRRLVVKRRQPLGLVLSQPVLDEHHDPVHSAPLRFVRRASRQSLLEILVTGSPSNPPGRRG